MTSLEKYRLMDIIWAMASCHNTATPIGKVINEIVQMLKDEGYQPEIVGGNRDHKIIKVDDQKYRVLKNRGWGKYDLIMID